MEVGAVQANAVLPEASLKKLEAASREFEAVFMAQMLKPMWEGVETDPEFGGGTGEDVMRDMLVQEYGKAMAQAGDFGLSSAVMAEMIRIQSQSQKAALQGGAHG